MFEELGSWLQSNAEVVGPLSQFRTDKPKKNKKK